ncbi:hypothetical protein MIR68_011863 [Amoeboaphelidium protococcarum]|nr:hypothetical protein MIR68_011863 [Amoeboaphelidium protococcarum]
MTQRVAFQLKSDAPKDQLVRLGQLFVNGIELQTPNCLLYTRNRCIPHLTPDLLARLNHPYLLYSWEQIIQTVDKSILESMPPTMSIRELLSIPKDQIAFATWGDSLKYNDTSVNGDKYVTCVSKKGHQRITPQVFDQYIQRGGLDFSSLLSDCPVDASLTRKRAQKSSDRTLSYYSSSRYTQPSDGDDDFNYALLGTVICCASESDEDVRYQSCQQMKSFQFPGYILEGLNLHENRDQFKNRIQFVTENLPQDSFKCLFGLRSIQDVFTAVENGVDIFDSSLAYELTEQSKVFNLVGDGGTLSDAYSIMEPQFADDQSPLVHRCTCYSCQSYSKGYVQHLLTVKEILGSTLLMMHNLHQFIAFTQQLRQSAIDGSYLQFKQKYTKIQ